VNRNHDHSAIVQGVTPLKAAGIEIPDLRAGFAYLMAALIADGESVVAGIENAKRGYSFIREKIAGIGGDIEEVSIGAARSGSTDVA
jgi:UDP-N-acetylglucosamine 1-carboxyvinyltransferase